MSRISLLHGTNRLILEALRQSDKPLGAYDLLSALGGQGVKNPPTVYRALKRLVALGLAHRIASLNAFVACHKEHECSVVAFAVCRNCKQVEEFDDASLDAVMHRLGQQHHFHTEQRVVELVGICQKCAGAATSGQISGKAAPCST